MFDHVELLRCTLLGVSVCFVLVMPLHVTRAAAAAVKQCCKAVDLTE